ncbi:MAG: ATP-binding cassette domain-containing protein [candidate division NC10 bacterium]|nr:ATP-binding cassette domain-containing protein [candidate division NC10 bacterium]
MTGLEVRDVHVKLAGFVILRGVTLSVPSGCIVGLVGRNGAGKTTTLKSIVGLVPVSGGEVRLDGQDLMRLAPHRRPLLGIGYLPEDRRLIGSLTVEENLLLPVWAAGQTNGKGRLGVVYDLMPEVKQLAARRATALSGGQQKMVALARAVVAGTRLLLLDEPFEGLAPLLSRHLAEVIRRLPGVTVLVTESDSNRMRLVTEHVYTIERGEIVGDPNGAGRDAPGVRGH